MRTSRLAALAAALALIALAAPAARATDPRDTPSRLVRLYPLEGLPGEAAARTAFTAGFDSVLAESTFAVERRDGAGGWRPAGTLRNAFRVTADPRADRVWTLQVVVGAPPPFAARRTNPSTRKPERFTDTSRRASRGMTLAVLALSPDAIAAGVRAMPDRYAFAFPPEAAPPAGDAGSAGYLFPWCDAGAAAATLAIELLHRRSGDLAEGGRLAIAPAQRADVVR